MTLKKILIRTLLSIVVLAAALVLFNQRDHNIAPTIAPPPQDSILSSFYLMDQGVMVSNTGSNIRKRLDQDLDFQVRLREITHTFMRPWPLTAKQFYQGMRKVEICDCFWTGAVFDFGTPQYHVKGLNGSMTMEVAFADSIGCCNDATLTSTDSVVVVFEDITSQQALDAALLEYFKQMGSTRYYPADLEKDTIYHTLDLQWNNPSKMINETHVLQQTQMQTTELFDPIKTNYKLLVKYELNRVTQNRDIVLKVDYQGAPSFQENIKLGHEVQALGYQLTSLDIQEFSQVVEDIASN